MLRALLLISCLVIIDSCSPSDKEESNSSDNESDEAQVERLGDKVLIKPILMEDDSFFVEYFEEIVKEKVLPMTDLDTLKFSRKQGDEPFMDYRYQSNFGFSGALYCLNIDSEDSEELVGVITADQHVWGSQYYLAVWRPTDFQMKLIDQLQQPHGMDSVKFGENGIYDFGRCVEIHYEQDLTSAYGGENGISFWKLNNDRLVKCKADERSW